MVVAGGGAKVKRLKGAGGTAAGAAGAGPVVKAVESAESLYGKRCVHAVVAHQPRRTIIVDLSDGLVDLCCWALLRRTDDEEPLAKAMHCLQPKAAHVAYLKPAHRLHSLTNTHHAVMLSACRELLLEEQKRLQQEVEEETKRVAAEASAAAKPAAAAAAGPGDGAAGPEGVAAAAPDAFAQPKDAAAAADSAGGEGGKAAPEGEGQDSLDAFMAYMDTQIEKDKVRFVAICGETVSLANSSVLERGT